MSIDYTNLLKDKLTSEFHLIDYMKNTPLVIQYYLLKSIYYVDHIIVAKPFTKYGWLLAINTTLGLWRDSNLIVYYNEKEPKYTSSIIIQELTGKALINEYGEVMSINKILNKTLSYLASFSSGFRDLYQEIISQYLTKLSVNRIRISEKYINFIKHDLVNVIIPRIIAYRLIDFDYNKVVEESVSDYVKLFEYWLNTKPSKVWIIALSNALKIAGYNPIDYELPDTDLVIEKTSYGYRYVFIHINEVDEKYIEMLRILRKALENRNKLEELLKEWWSEISSLGEIELLKKGFIVPDIFSID